MFLFKTILYYQNGIMYANKKYRFAEINFSIGFFKDNNMTKKNRLLLLV